MKRWKILSQNQESRILNQEEVVHILIKNRGIENIGEFMEPRLEGVTLEAVGIDRKEVEKTLDLIKKTIEEKKAIVIYGDYDVDGICATAILWETLYQLYKDVHPYIPHRMDEGYGLSEKGIKNLEFRIKNIGLIITVDNGIVAGKAVEFARSKNINVVVTDHHTKGKTLPKANSIIHTTELCGTGIAYLLAKEIESYSNTIHETASISGEDSSPSSTQGQNDIREKERHLELVALATVADLVPLNKYNRTLLKFGLEKLRTTKRPGLLALFDEAKIEKEKIDTYHIGHIIAPRLNASGRITHALDSLRLICTTDKTRAGKLANTLGEVNRERQQMTFDSAEDAKTRIMKQESGITNILFVESEDYDQGVVGLIASRLVEEFYRPSIAVSIGEKISKGSARSIPGVNIIELIRSVPDFLSEAGGHPMAAGFSLRSSKLNSFKKALQKQALKTIDKKLFDRELKIDLELPFDLVNLELYEALKTLSPFGIGNPSPVFMTKGVTLVSMNKVGKDGAHLQMGLEKDGTVFKGIFFKSGETTDLKIGQLIDIAYTLEVNEWNGNKKIELKVKDIVFI